MPQGKCSFVQLKSSKDLSTVLCSVPCSPKAFLMANFSTSSFNTHRELHLKYLLVDFFWEFMLRLLDSNDHTHILTHRQMGKYILHKSPTGHCYSREVGLPALCGKEEEFMSTIRVLSPPPYFHLHAVFVNERAVGLFSQ